MSRFNNGLKKLMLIYGGILLILIITFVTVYIIYNNKLKESAKQSLLATEKITELVPNNALMEEASTDLSKTIEEAIEEGKNEILERGLVENEIEETTNLQNVEQEPKNQIVEDIEPIVEEEPIKELEFMYPVEGEIIKEYAMENLVFSETLQEWIVHKGIDIKAPRTTVVKAAEEGQVQSIKTDPRYGLSVIIEHRDGYKTIYANLLTAEFVKEGENVTKGQSLGTVGNSAAFEIADEPHLHFELFKEGENVDPTLYLKQFN